MVSNSLDMCDTAIQTFLDKKATYVAKGYMPKLLNIFEEMMQSIHYKIMDDKNPVFLNAHSISFEETSCFLIFSFCYECLLKDKKRVSKLEVFAYSTNKDNFVHVRDRIKMYLDVSVYDRMFSFYFCYQPNNENPNYGNVVYHPTDAIPLFDRWLSVSRDNRSSEQIQKEYNVLKNHYNFQFNPKTEAFFIGLYLGPDGIGKNFPFLFRDNLDLAKMLFELGTCF